MSLISRSEIMMNGQLEYRDNRAARNAHGFHEKTFTDSVIGTLYVQKAVFGNQSLVIIERKE